MISTLRDLIAPLTEEEFLAIIRTRTLTLRRNVGENRFADLLKWDVLRGVIESDNYPHESLRVFANTELVPPIFYRQQGKVSPERLTSLVRQGASFMANRVEDFVPALRALCAHIAARLAEDVQFTAVMTAGRGGAVKRHYDHPDAAVFQLAGSKRWRIYGPAVAYPVRGMAKPPMPNGAPFFDEILHEGDFLYMPSGHWHDCENGPGHSLHLSLLIYPLSGFAALKSVLKRMSEEEIMRVPLARLESVEDRIAGEAALKARMIEAINNSSLLECRGGAAKTGYDDEPY